MFDTYSDHEHSVITSSSPMVDAEFFIASGYAKIRSIEFDGDHNLVGYITPKCSSDRSAINALADKLEHYDALKGLAEGLRKTVIGGVTFN